MDNFFPPGFWSGAIIFFVVVFSVLGIDMLLGAKLMMSLGKKCNQKFHVDQMVIHALTELKKNSDKEYDTEKSLVHGSGRYVAGAVLLSGAAMMFFLLLPRLH